MLSPADIQAQALRQYPSVLRAIVMGQSAFPKEIRFGRPNPTAEWATLQEEITALAQAKLGYEIEWEEINTRRWGRQRLPVRVWFQHEGDFLRMIGKSDEVSRFRGNLELTRKQCPELEGWLASHVLRVVEYERVWPEVLKVCRYFVDHPRPGRYLRELPIAVGTKFIEERRSIFRSLFDFLLPTETIVSDSDHFETRYGLRYDESLIRLRVLDRALQYNLGLLVTDVSIPLSQFQALPWRDVVVVVAENKMNFLTLPECVAVGIWGGGDAAALLATVPWLKRCDIVYWGDIDVHGFEILSHLRRTFPRVESVMMDHATLAQFTEFVVKAKPSATDRATGLTADELALRAHVQSRELLLEQEKIPAAYSSPRILASVTAARMLSQRSSSS